MNQRRTPPEQSPWAGGPSEHVAALQRAYYPPPPEDLERCAVPCAHPCGICPPLDAPGDQP